MRGKLIITIFEETAASLPVREAGKGKGKGKQYQRSGNEFTNLELKRNALLIQTKNFCRVLAVF